MAAEAAVSTAVATLGNLLIQKVAFLRGVEAEVQSLRDEFRRMQPFLKDAARKQAHDERIRNWISEIREVAYDAEDAIEMFILKVEKPTRSRGLLVSFPISFPNKVGKEINSIRRRLDYIDERRRRYGIQDLGEGVDSSTRRSEDVERRWWSAPWSEDEHLVGLDGNVEVLLQNSILEERKGLSIAAIVGMGGIGKSTLARKIYNHAKVANRFECRAWVMLSSEFTPEDTIKQIMRQLQIHIDDRLKDVEYLQETLCQHLSGKQYFIVLDDVWEPSYWESLRSAFPNEQDKSSRLLVTSRNSTVIRSAQYVHKMMTLDEDKSRELLLKKALFRNTTDANLPGNLENIGREILTRCGGLPSAITVVGGLLLEEGQSRSGWEKVLRRMDSHLGSSTVSEVLELSYWNLRPKLKQCFLFLSFLKEDTIIRAEKLIHIWIAEGLIPEEEGEMTMEEIGRSYLDELGNRNLIQVKEMTMGEVKSCNVHDIFRMLSIAKAREEIKFDILRAEGSSQSSSRPRHLAIYCDRKSFIYSKKQNKRLRSLLFYGNLEGLDFKDFSSRSYWESFELLRVLDFEDFPLGSLPEATGEVIVLRYLGLRNTGIRELPRSLGGLKKLEVLDIVGNFFRQLPDVICELEGLRHLYADPTWSRAPPNMVALKNIQTLSYVSITSLMSMDLAQLTSLRKLGVYVDIADSDFSKLYNSLAKLSHFVFLSIRLPQECDNRKNSRNENVSDFLDGSGVLQHLNKLELQGVNLRIRLPSVGFPPNISHLVLARMLLDEDSILLLEKLARLKYLELERTSILGKTTKMVISPGKFPRLQVLVLRRVSISPRNLQVEEEAKQLKRLEVYQCRVSLNKLREEWNIAMDVNIICTD